MFTVPDEMWFENWKIENREEFVIKGILLKAVSAGNVVEEDVVNIVIERIESVGEFEASRMQIRLMLLRLMVHYGYIERDEEGLLLLTEEGRKVVDSPFTYEECLIGNYVNDLIVNADFV